MHFVLWFLGPWLTRPSLPHDVLEGITWGMQWSLGYNKHPFLAAWVVGFFTQLFNTVGWPIYFAAQILNTLTFVATYLLAQHLLSRTQALVATLLLEGVLFYNVNSFNLTPDTLQSPLWAMLSLLFYLSLTQNKLKYWIGTGIFAALSLVTKYQAFFIFTPMFIFCLYNKKARLAFKDKGLYLALCVLILLIIPHVSWLINHDFITLKYVSAASDLYSKPQTLFGHLFSALAFAFNIIAFALPMLLLFWPFYKQKQALTQTQTSHFNKEFIIFMGLGPFALTILASLYTGNIYPSRWATPYCFLWGILLVSYFKPHIKNQNLKAFLITLLFYTLMLWAIRITPFITQAPSKSDAYLPNQAIAHHLEHYWYSHYQDKLPFLAGSHYLVALTTPYFHEKPKPFMDWRQDESAGVSDEDINLKGGLFIWDISHRFMWDEDSLRYANLPANIKTRFPDLQILKPQTFKVLCRGCQPLVIGMGIVPPKSKPINKNK